MCSDPNPTKQRGTMSTRQCLLGRSRRRSKRTSRGFSLIEIMVVVVIIALLAGVVGVSVAGYTDKARATKAKADLATIAGAVKSYYGENGKYPDPSEGLEVLVPDYLDQMIADPWGGAYQYEMPGREGPFDVICFGADGRDGGEGKDADLTNWGVTESDETQP